MKKLLRVRFIEAINFAGMPNRKSDTPLTNSEAVLTLTDDERFVEVRPLKTSIGVVTRVPVSHVAYMWIDDELASDEKPSKPASKPAKA